MNDIATIALVLIGARIGGEIAKRARQPVILGELITGILLGSSFLGVIERTPALDLLSDLGIIFLLFLAGLEIDTKRLKSVGKVVVVDSIFDVVFAFLLGYSIGLLFHMPHLSALFLGGILTATSVGITTRTLMDIGKLDTKAGTTIIGVAVLDDVQGIFVLSILAGIATNNQIPSLNSFLTLLFMIVGFFTILLFVLPRIIEKANVLIEKMWVEEASFSLTIALILLVSFIAEEIGMAHIVGAFAIGLSMNLAIKYKENILTKFNTVTYGFLAPFFFVEVGLRTDVSAVLKTGFLITLAIILAAAIGKISGCTLGSFIMGYSKKDSFRVGLGMLPRAEVALITAKIGLTAEVITQGIFSSVVLMVLVMALATPPLVSRIFQDDA